MSAFASGSRPRHQRGQAALLVVFLVGMVATLLVYGMIDTTSAALRRDKDMAAVLAQAKQALIGRAAADNNRPGSLPCPDTDNDGSAELFVGDECPSYIGRLPWRTLGLPDLRDDSGERLWYAVTREYARNPSCLPTCPLPLNSDSKGGFIINGTSPATDIVAVVFAPGQTTDTQVRSTPNQNTVAHYLEGGNETGIGTSTFITGPTTTTFNDHLLALTGADIMTPVELRAAKEVLTLLDAYRNSPSNWCACYPWADTSNGSANEGRLYGRVPLVSAETDSTPEWSDLNINTTTYPALSWLNSNQWWYVFFYTVSDSQSANHGLGTLTVDGTPNFGAVLITTGPAGAGRPVCCPGSWDDANWSIYLNDDSRNYDFDSSFFTPTTTTYARDRLYKR